MKNKIKIIGIQGGKGSFNEEALIYSWDKNIPYTIKYLYTTKRVLNALENGDIDYGQFAIFNSNGGLVDESIYASARFKYKIIDKYALNVKHHLMCLPTVDIGQIREIMAHPQCFEQCKNKLQSRYSQLTKTVGEGKFVDPAYAAKQLAEGKLPSHIAILGNKTIAQNYNLKIIDRNLQDNDENYTTFLLVTSA